MSIVERRIISICVREAPEMRQEGSEMPLLEGHFAVFNTPTTINGREGHFIERIAPGAFKRTIANSRDQMKVLFQHGRDPQIGDKPLGVIEELSEDATGAHYAVRMLDTSYNRDLIPGLKAKVYGSSFRFQVVDEEIEEYPERSADNPEGLPVRTVKEAKVLEFGPVTFPAYSQATALVRMDEEWRALDAFMGAAEVIRDEKKLEWIRSVFERPALDEVRNDDAEPDKTDEAEADPPADPEPADAEPAEPARAAGGGPLYGSVRKARHTGELRNPTTEVASPTFGELSA